MSQNSPTRAKTRSEENGASDSGIHAPLVYLYRTGSEAIRNDIRIRLESDRDVMQDSRARFLAQLSDPADRDRRSKEWDERYGAALAAVLAHLDAINEFERQRAA